MAKKPRIQVRPRRWGCSNEGVLQTLLRKIVPKLLARDILGVQPMTGPVGKIFTIKTIYYTPWYRRIWNRFISEIRWQNRSGYRNPAPYFSSPDPTVYIIRSWLLWKNKII